MLFNSYVFIFAFLPVALFGFFALGSRYGHRIATVWLVAASLFFYGWWNPNYLSLILISILFNYSIGILLSQHSSKPKINKTWLLSMGVSGNLMLLAYFKYANFFVDNVNGLTGSQFHLNTIILPLAISFFTFQQIAYLIDAHRGETREYNFLHYCLFVTFFPQLIAGPIVHHREMLPQFADKKIFRLSTEHMAAGLTIFIIGLFKKVVIADTLALYATPVFAAADQGASITFFEAWGGALAYTFQLYFDFSGYSDMAIGIARMFGIRLPLNFSSPYKALNIIGFWHCWHMTLSRFLRDYLYFPLGGNRKGKARRYANLMITMVLGGLWHGAGWTFVAWGSLHGLYLILNHAWHALRKTCGLDGIPSSMASRFIAGSLTFLSVVFSWVFFRAESFDGAMQIITGMVGTNGFYLDPSWLQRLGELASWLQLGGVVFADTSTLITFKMLLALILAAVIAWFMPNTQEFMCRYKPAFDFSKGDAGRTSRLIWQPSRNWALGIAVLAVFAFSGMTRISEFLYFQF